MPPLWIVLLLLPILGGAERFNCRGRILGAYYADAKSGCKAFHVCVRVAGGGIRDFRFFCPPGTLFHQEAQTCTDWGDDDPLACPADLYDGYDTKKVTSSSSRDEESEFGLQRAETGDRRLSQNQNNANNGASDLRAAHSSDFFSGQRDRGRDEPVAPQPAPHRQPSRQSFRRPTTRVTPAVQYTTQTPSASPQPSSSPHYETSSKRKLVRKRPIYVSTAAPTTTQRPLSQQQSSQQPYVQQAQQNYYRLPQNRQTTLPPADVPPQYKDEYVEVVRVAPKQTPNRYYPSNPTTTPSAQTTFAPQFSKKEGLAELYNYEAQSTPGFNVQNDKQPFKVRNSFSVSNNPREDFARTNVNYNSNSGRGTPTTTDYTTSRGFATSTSSFNNFNSISSEPENNKFSSYREQKQNYFNSPSSTISTTTFYTTTRSDRPSNLNTVAYNTNIALNTIQPANYVDHEDDGQYRPPPGEDDGQYRPELYERELLSGAHSLNIAASGNRLPEEQKQKQKQKTNHKQSQSPAPRPFRPAPTSAPVTTTRVPETTYATTYRVPTTTYNTQRTFDYFQTYTTTSRPYSEPVQTFNNYSPVNSGVSRTPATTVPGSEPPAPVTRPTTRAPQPPTVPPARPSTRAPNFSKPASKNEDNSYDYAYYDSDPGFSEYDHIEEFGKTKTRT